MNTPDFHKTIVFNEEAIGITIHAHTVIFNGASKNIIIEQAKKVIFNASCENPRIEYTGEIINNKQQ